MEIVPQLLVVGFYAELEPLDVDELNNQARISRLWTDVSSDYEEFKQLTLSPDGNAAQFGGPIEDEAVVIQPPLFQGRFPIEFTQEQTAAKAADIFRRVATHLRLTDPKDVGVRHILHVPAPNGDAVAFLHDRVLGTKPKEMELLSGEGRLLGGIKWIVEEPNIRTTITIEPFFSDPTYVYLDVDRFYLGPANLADLVERCNDAYEFVQTRVGGYLDQLG